MSKRRVVVTGLGAVTPIGNSVEEFWEGIREGKTGIGPITRFDAGEYKVRLVAEVKDFDPKKYMEPKMVRRMAPFAQYAVAAAKEAFADAGLDMEKEDPFRAGVIIGSGVGDLHQVELCYEKILTKGPVRVAASYGSSDDFQYGCRKCFNPVRTSGKMFRRSDCLCFRYPQYR